MTEIFEQDFIKGFKKVDKYMKMSSTSLFIREMKTKAMMICYHTFIRMTKIKSTDKSPYWPNCREQERALFSTTSLGKYLAPSTKATLCLPYKHAILIPSTSTKNEHVYIKIPN